MSDFRLTENGETKQKMPDEFEFDVFALRANAREETRARRDSSGVCARRDSSGVCSKCKSMRRVEVHGLLDCGLPQSAVERLRVTDDVVEIYNDKGRVEHETGYVSNPATCAYQGTMAFRDTTHFRDRDNTLVLVTSAGEFIVSCESTRYDATEDDVFTVAVLAVNRVAALLNARVSRIHRVCRHVQPVAGTDDPCVIC